MEEESKISFFKKIKTSIVGLEDYQKLAVQKIGSTIGYLSLLMLIFAFFIAILLTHNFITTVSNVKQYIETQISEINFENNILKVTPNNNAEAPIIIEDTTLLNGKLIIDTNTVSEDKLNKYNDEIKGYTNGIIILKDKVMVKAGVMTVPTGINFEDISNQYHIVKLDKQDIINMLENESAWMIYITFFITMYIYLFIIYFSTILVDAILYSILAYFTGAMSKLKLKYSANYNIAVYALTLPIILNLIYSIVNLMTGYTVKYFNIMYMAITCIYIVTAILMIKSDIIKRQMELSRIISEQEKVKQEIARREQEEKEEEERERIRKEDEKRRQKEKKKDEGSDTTPQPEANIKFQAKERNANE